MSGSTAGGTKVVRKCEKINLRGRVRVVNFPFTNVNPAINYLNISDLIPTILNTDLKPIRTKSTSSYNY